MSLVKNNAMVSFYFPWCLMKGSSLQRNWCCWIIWQESSCGLHQEREGVTMSSGMLMQRIWLRLLLVQSSLEQQGVQREPTEIKTQTRLEPSGDPGSCHKLAFMAVALPLLQGLGSKGPDGSFNLFSTKARADRLPAGDDRENHSCFWKG